MRMNARDKALRAQDIQAGIQGLSEIPSLVESEMDATLLTGMACRLATHIRGADVFGADDIPRLKYVAKSLGIQSVLLPEVLDVLQEAEFVTVRKSTGGTLNTVRENIPTFGDLYRTIGEVFESKESTEVEKALITSYNEIVLTPQVDNGQLDMLKLAEKYRIPLLDVAGQSGLIKVTYSPNKGNEVYYSPQYWDENVEKLAEVLDTYGDESVQNVVKKVRAHQGTPVPAADTKEGKIFGHLVDNGMLPSPIVTGVGGKRIFAFTPFQGGGVDKLLNPKVIEKARAILACVRYGENFAKASSIKSASILLRALKDRGQIGPHSEIYQQYKLLIDQGIGRISRSTTNSNRFFLHLIKNEENEVALEAAINLLEEGAPLSATHVDPDIKHYAMNGDYEEPTTARARKVYSASSDAFKELQAELINILVIR